MCIIAYTTKKKLLKPATIKECFINNPDGAGFMYRNTKFEKVIVKKGFMSSGALLKALHDVPDNAEIAVHCRIATSGSITGGLCHPFPIAEDYKTMRKLEGTYRGAVVHNGVISYCEPVEGIKATHSDTMAFIKNYLVKFRPYLETKEIKTIIERSTPSRFLVMEQGKDTIFMGTWTDDEGCKFSNSSYKPYKYEYKNYQWEMGGQPLEEDVYTLAITLKGIANNSDTEVYNDILDVIDELDIDGCYPDFDGMDYYQIGDDIVMEICVLQVPSLKTVLEHEYKLVPNYNYTQPTKKGVII